MDAAFSTLLVDFIIVSNELYVFANVLDDKIKIFNVNGNNPQSNFI